MRSAVLGLSPLSGETRTFASVTNQPRQPGLVSLSLVEYSSLAHCTILRLLARYLNVLPDRSDIPAPMYGRFDDGQYSAVAGNSGGLRVGPSVLPGFVNFHAHDLELLSGSFSAVSEDQDIEYETDDQQQ